MGDGLRHRNHWCLRTEKKKIRVRQGGGGGGGGRSGVSVGWSVGIYCICIVTLSKADRHARVRTLHVKRRTVKARPSTGGGGGPTMPVKDEEMPITIQGIYHFKQNLRTPDA